MKARDPGGGWFTRVQVEMDASFSLGPVKGIMRGRMRPAALTLRNGYGNARTVGELVVSRRVLCRGLLYIKSGLRGCGELGEKKKNRLKL